MAAHDLLARALESVANAIFITDPEGRIIWVNRAFCALSGYSADEAIGSTPRLLKSGQQDRVFYRALWQALTKGEVWHGDIINRRKDGSVYIVEQIEMRPGGKARRRRPESEFFLRAYSTLSYFSLCIRDRYRRHGVTTRACHAIHPSP